MQDFLKDKDFAGFSFTFYTTVCKRSRLLVRGIEERFFLSCSDTKKGLTVTVTAKPLILLVGRAGIEPATR